MNCSNIKKSSPARERHRATHAAQRVRQPVFVPTEETVDAAKALDNFEIGKTESTEQVVEVSEDKIEETVEETVEASVDSVEAPAEEAMEAPVGETVDAELEIEEAIDEEKAEEKVEETVEELIESVAGKAPTEEAMETPVGETLDAEVQIVEEMAEQTKSEETREVAPVIVTVYATAFLENSERSEVSSDDIESISRILKSKDHLCRNVGNVSFRLIRSERLRSGYFEDQV